MNPVRYYCRWLGLVWVASVLILVLATSKTFADIPEWWVSQGVIQQQVNKQTVAADDYAALNQGQLKQLCSAAVAEMNDKFQFNGGAGQVLNDLVRSWHTPNIDSDDYAVVTLGQLKTVAEPVYDRLISAKMTSSYPWLPHSSGTDDYALANVGQAKALFSFSFLTDDSRAWLARYKLPPSALNIDSDLDGVTNWHEYLRGTDPTDFYNGKTPKLNLLDGGGQWGQPGEVVARPISVSIDGGVANAPATFSVTSGGALFSLNGKAPWFKELMVRSDPSSRSHEAQAFVKLPASASSVSNISISAGLLYHAVTLQTTATTYDATVPMPTALKAESTSSTTIQLSWVPGDITRATSIEISRDEGRSWQLYDVADPGVSSFKVDGLTPNQQVLLRVLTGDKRKAGK